MLPADTQKMLRCLAALTACLLLALPAGAVIIDFGDGSGNTTAPPDDPGWKYVGLRTGLSAVYLGNGWVISADHVLIGNITLDGVTYPYVPGSKISIGSADLAVWQLDPAPHWPLLPISSVADISGEEVIMIGQGWDRGASTNICAPAQGHFWAETKTRRWGENEVVDHGFVDANGKHTMSVYTSYDKFGLTYEAQAAHGDSGGGVFVKNAGEWELAAIMTLRGQGDCQRNQPAWSAIHGNQSFAADLAFYRDMILPIVRPACSDELDNDGDLLVDYPDDPECKSEFDDNESPPKVPSASPAGLLVLAGSLLGAGQRRRQSR